MPNPLTGFGLRLGEATELSAPRFVIHECGFLPQSGEPWEADDVSSPFWRLWHTMEPGHWMESQGQRVDLGPDRIVFVPADVVFSNHSSASVPQLWVHFSLVPHYAFTATSSFYLEVDALLHELVTTLVHLHLAVRHDAVREIYHHSIAMLNLCFSKHPLQLRALPDTLTAILHDIENGLANDLTNSHLAQRANLSTSGFIRWFEKYMHQSPAAYVRDVRHCKATRLLVFSDSSIEQIAAELGFPNRHHFSRAFATMADCGPSTFRKKHRQSVKE